MNSSQTFYRKIAEQVQVKVLTTDLDMHTHFSLPIIFVDLPTIKEQSLPEDVTFYDAEPHAPWLIITGSGSTGHPKLIPVSHKQEIARTSISVSGVPISNSDNKVASLIPFPFSDTIRRFLETFLSGATFILLDSTRGMSIDAYKNAGVSILRTSVFHMEQLLRILPKDTQYFLGFLKVLSVGTATVSNDLRKRICEQLTPNLYVTYGTNETGIVSATYLTEVYNTSATVGHPFPGVKIEIVDQNDHPLPPNEQGELRIQSPGMISAYLYNKEATKKMFKNGWFYPGDLGKFTKDGQLIHMGRTDHMMIMNGINIYPIEIEQCISMHPEVIDIAVLPLKSAIHQDIPICAVVLSSKSKLSEKDLLDFSHQHLGSRGPKRIIILDTIDRNKQGKLLKTELVKKIKVRLSQL